ncbi:MAG: hypothetical protein PVH29_04570 [Candidatus Zixiibacteriota bacterium]|jgi:hypothetical protein
MPAEAKDEDFVAAVAEYFIRRRGRGTMLSPADLEVLAEWEKAGLDAGAAMRAIDEAFRRQDDIRTLRQCSWAAEAELRKGRPDGGTRAE